MRALIAVMCCEKFAVRAALLRSTWVKAAVEIGLDVRFFVGRGASVGSDTIALDVDDDYLHLRQKVQAMFRWSLDAGYDSTLKVDDDVLVIPQRAVALFDVRNYVGRVRGPSQENDAPRIYGKGEKSFCSGFGYVLSRRAAEIVANAPDNTDWAEDRFSGQALASASIFPNTDERFALWPPLEGHFCSRPNPNCARCRQRYGNAAVICPYASPYAVDDLWRSYVETGFIPTHL